MQSRLATACGLDPDAHRNQGDPHHRRRHPGPAAGRSRRQRPVHQGDRGGAARRRDRSRRAFLEGHADRAAGRARALRPSCRARMRATRLSGRKAKTLRDLPRGAVVGTASLRRQALVKHLRPDLKIVPLRGNVETRLRKLEAGDFDATVARGRRIEAARPACARRPSLLDADEFVPAVGQGAIGIETRDDDAQDARAGRRRSTMPTPRPRLPPNAPSSPCSTAPAARRSAATRASTARPSASAASSPRPTAAKCWRFRARAARADAAKLGADAGRELKARAGAGFFCRGLNGADSAHASASRCRAHRRDALRARGHEVDHRAAARSRDVARSPISARVPGRRCW